MKTKAAVRHVGDVAIVDVERQLTCGQVEEYFTEPTCQLIEAGEKKILVNLRRCRFLDNSGLAGIATCCLKATEGGAELRVCEVEEQSKLVQDLLKMMLIYAGSEEQAIASFGTGPGES